MDFDKFKLKSMEIRIQQNKIDISSLLVPIEGMAKMASLLIWETLCFAGIIK